MRILIVRPLILASCLFASACGSDDPAGTTDTNPSQADGADGADTSASDTTVSDTNGDTGGSAFDALIGDWEIPCRPLPGGSYGLSRLHVTATSVENTYTAHSEPTCSDASRLLEFYVEDEPWVIGEPFGEGLAVDMVLRAACVTITDARIVGDWNNGSGCGPFTAGVEKDVAGMTCYGFWRPEAGETYYSIIAIDGDTFLFGASASGDMKTPATRSTQLARGDVWQRAGADGEGFIEGTIEGTTYRAEDNAAARLVQQGHIQLGASTRAVAPWETWIVNMPNAVGTYDCEDDSINAYINFGFTEDNLPVLWDTEQDGGAGCTITVTKAADAVGDTIEGTFAGTLGDGDGAGHAASAGSFRLVRLQ